MNKQKNFRLRDFAAGMMVFFLLVSFPALCQGFPDKPITVYCGFSAGATTDLTARGLSEEAQKITRTLPL